MNLGKYFWSAPAWRANLEGCLLAVPWLAVLAYTARYLQTFPLFQGVVLIGAAVPSLVGLRREALPGAFGPVLILEILQAGLISAGLTLFEYVLLSYFDVPSNMVQISQIPDPLVYLVSAAIYLFWRAFQRAWQKWNALRETRFAWSLTHAILVVVCGLALVMVTAVVLIVPINGTQTVKEGAPELAVIFTRVIGFLFFVLLASPFALVPVLVVLLPPTALASYVVSRRLTRRLGRLESAAARLSQGEWHARVAPEGRDEIGRLQDSFNRMAAELEKANQALVEQRDRVSGLLKVQRELTASVSHELRTPVATALVYLENDLDRLETLPPEVLRQDLEIAHHEIARLENLIDDLFTLSKAEVNQLTLDMAVVSLAPLVERAVAASAGLAWDARRVRVEDQIPKQLPDVWADAQRVEQVLRNLLANGVRHTPPGGFVVVTAEETPDGVRMAVTDTGEGIHPEDREHIWERFYRGGGQPGDGRSGLGLAIVKELVESMGGRVGVESEPDQGSTFTFYLQKTPIER